MAGYAVLDFETTGLFPQKHDRVVEMAVILLDQDGCYEREWSSLVNPQRDVGPTYIHGIRARDVLGAPTFAQIASLVMASLRGRTVVAHNAAFELKFLDYELTRAGWPTPRPFSSICTMAWSKQFLNTSSRTLADCCDALGVTLPFAHQVRDDARGVAQLLAGFLLATHPEILWREALSTAALLEWPSCDGATANLCERGSAAPVRPSAWLDRIVARMPRKSDLVEAYLAVLESALLDKYLSVHEEAQLVELGCELGLSRSDLDTLHRSYLLDMAGVALADSVVTEDERNDLETVAELLGFDSVVVDQVLEQAIPAPTERGGMLLSAGDCVCLTGTMHAPREQITELAESRGLTVGGLTRRTKILVAADPDSLSGKACKAREYGVTIVNEVAFLSYLIQMP